MEEHSDLRHYTRQGTTRPRPGREGGKESRTHTGKRPTLALSLACSPPGCAGHPVSVRAVLRQRARRMVLFGDVRSAPSSVAHLRSRTIGDNGVENFACPKRMLLEAKRKLEISQRRAKRVSGTHSQIKHCAIQYPIPNPVLVRAMGDRRRYGRRCGISSHSTCRFRKAHSSPGAAGRRYRSRTTGHRMRSS